MLNVCTTEVCRIIVMDLCRIWGKCLSSSPEISQSKQKNQLITILRDFLAKGSGGTGRENTGFYVNLDR